MVEQKLPKLTTRVRFPSPAPFLFLPDRLIRRLAAGLLFLAVSTVPPAVQANGWEHWGVPLEVLLRGLAGDQPEYQVAAARSLGFRRETAAVPPLLQLIGREGTPPPVIGAALEALGRIGDARAVEPLHAVLRQAPREELRGDAALALGSIADPSSLPVLLAALRGEPTLTARAAVIEALGAYRQDEAIAAVAGVLDDSRQRALWPRAIRALGRMGPKAAPPLIGALRAVRSDGARLDLVEAIGRSGAAEAVEPLAALLATATAPDLRAATTVALGSIRDGNAVPALIARLEDEAAPVQYYAVRGLATAGDPRAAAPLRALHARLAGRAQSGASLLSDLSLRIEIVTALIEIDAPGSYALFREALNRREFPRDSALGLRLNEGIYELRRAATVGLGYSRNPEAAALLAGGPLADGDFRLRAAAVRALGVLGAPGALTILLPRLGDESPEVRWETAFVLARLGRPEAIPALLPPLDDPHAEVRRQAALALGILGARDARERIAAMAAGDSDTRTRAGAAAALLQLSR